MNDRQTNRRKDDARESEIQDITNMCIQSQRDAFENESISTFYGKTISCKSIESVCSCFLETVKNFGVEGVLYIPKNSEQKREEITVASPERKTKVTSMEKKFLKEAYKEIHSKQVFPRVIRSKKIRNKAVCVCEWEKSSFLITKFMKALELGIYALEVDTQKKRETDFMTRIPNLTLDLISRMLEEVTILTKEKKITSKIPNITLDLITQIFTIVDFLHLSDAINDSKKEEIEELLEKTKTQVESELEKEKNRRKKSRVLNEKKSEELTQFLGNFRDEVVTLLQEELMRMEKK